MFSEPSFCDPFTRAAHLLLSGQRRLLGLAGAPGVGKSTLADRLAARCGKAAAVVPMDGFHLANVQLARLGYSGRKGAPETFDAAGYVALLRRLRTPHDGEVIYAPAFAREIEEPIAGSIAIDPAVKLVITEGNYLLCDGRWAEVRPLLDEVWYVDGDDDGRRERLLARHVSHGRTRRDANDWIKTTDDPNAALIQSTRSRADWLVAFDALPPLAEPGDIRPQSISGG